MENRSVSFELIIITACLFILLMHAEDNLTVAPLIILSVILTSVILYPAIRLLSKIPYSKYK